MPHLKKGTHLYRKSILAKQQKPRTAFFTVEEVTLLDINCGNGKDRKSAHKTSILTYVMMKLAVKKELMEKHQSNQSDEVQ